MIELIIVVETRASNRSDWMYIKSALDYYYGSRTYGISPIFAKCKPELITQDKKIDKAIKDSKRTPYVVICTDYDRDEDLNNKIIKYCNDNNYNLVWMNLDVEDVFWGEQVPDKDKKRKAVEFQSKKDKLLPNVKGLESNSPLKKRHQSNLLLVCDTFLKRKQ